MNYFQTLLVLIILALCAQASNADTVAEEDRLKVSAIEALMSAPSEKALPVLTRVMSSNNSDTVKSRALFVIGQFDVPEAHAIILDMARYGEGKLQASAIRSIGIGGNSAVIAELHEIYQSGSEDVKQQILQAYLIAGDAEAMLKAALTSEDPRIFDAAVRKLGAMGATKQLKQLRERAGTSRTLIHAYAIAGDTDSLIAIANDTSSPEQQQHAIHGLSIAGGGQEVADTLVDIYVTTSNREVRDSAMHGLMVGGFDSSLLTLFKQSTDQKEKSELLRQLVIMDSDIAMQAIDSALSGE